MPPVSPYIQRLTKMLDPNSLVLDMGADDGYYGNYIASFGHRVLSLEKDPEAAKKGQKKLADLGDLAISNTFIIADMQDDIFPDQSFDAVIASNSLQHVLPLSESKVALGRIMRLAQPGGLNLIKAYIGDKDQRHLKSEKYSVFGPNQIQAIYQTAGWDLVDVRQTPGPYVLAPDGSITASVEIIARKPD